MLWRKNLIEVGYFAEANENARRATAIDPLVAIYRNTLGRTFIFTGEVEAALDAFEKAMEVGPKFRFPKGAESDPFSSVIRRIRSK